MTKTITTLEKELAHIRKGRAKGMYENGTFGVKACKESIRFHCYINNNQPLKEYYVELIVRGLTELGFNTNMIVACEELMNEGE